jgi:hypothetical protein
MRRFHLAAGCCLPDDPTRARRSVAVYSRFAASNRASAAGETRFPCRLFELAAPQKSSIAPRGHFGKFSFVDALAERPRLWPGLRHSSARRRTTSMAGTTPSAGSGGSRGIAGGRDRVRKSLYAAAESSLGRGSLAAWHARLHPRRADWRQWSWQRVGPLTEPDDRCVVAVIPPKADRKTNIPMRIRHRPLASPH